MPRRSQSAQPNSGSFTKKTWTVTVVQEDFIRRKVRELQRVVPQKRSQTVTESFLIQSLITFWMESEVEGFEHKVIDRIKVGQAGDGSADSS